MSQACDLSRSQVSGRSARRSEPGKQTGGGASALERDTCLDVYLGSLSTRNGPFAIDDGDGNARDSVGTRLFRKTSDLTLQFVRLQKPYCLQAKKTKNVSVTSGRSPWEFAKTRGGETDNARLETHLLVRHETSGFGDVGKDLDIADILLLFCVRFEDAVEYRKLLHLSAHCVGFAG